MAKSKILILMFHKVYDRNTLYQPAKFSKYLEYLTQNFHITNIDNIKPNQLNIILTFDDAYYDFYYYVYPLLKKYNVPAILGVSSKYILDNTNLSDDIRLNIAFPTGMDNDLYKTHAPFCTYQELAKMHQSGLVHIAAHGHKHLDLADLNTNFKQEIVYSKQLLQSKLNIKINKFIYPFGNWCRASHKLAMLNYTHIFRIGSAINLNQSPKSKLFYRVDADHLWLQNQAVTSKLLNKWQRKYYLNWIRNK